MAVKTMFGIRFYVFTNKMSVYLIRICLSMLSNYCTDSVLYRQLFSWCLYNVQLIFVPKSVKISKFQILIVAFVLNTKYHRRSIASLPFETKWVALLSVQPWPQ